MAIKDLLVYVDNDAACAQRIGAARQLAKAYQAHLAGLYVKRRIVIPAYAGIYIPAEIFEANEEMTDGLAAKAKEVFHAETSDTGLETQWFQEDLEVNDALTTHGHYVDLVVTAQHNPEDDMQNEHYRPDALIMGCGRPVLVVPYTGTQGLPPERVFVAWNGRRESVRALHDALPLLLGAKEVAVVTVDPKGDEPIPGADISLHLARHGVKATAQALPSGDISVGDAILSRAADTGVDLIVMGAYGHSRLREMVTGGVTRHILEHMTVPVLFSH